MDEKGRDHEEYYRTEDEGNSSLNRDSLLGGKNPKKNSGSMIVFVLGVIIVGWAILSHNGKKEKEGLIQENEQFEPASKRPVKVPDPLPSPPVPVSQKGLSEEDLAKLKEAEALRQTRLKSGIVIFQGGSANVSKATLSSPEGEKEVSSNGISIEGQKTSSDPNTQFQQSVQTSTFPKTKASSLGNLGTLVLQGKLIDAVLETAVNSDLPGMVRALVSHDVYAESGNRVLIPRGSRLVGQYNSAIRKGQARVFIVWNRLIRPDGIEVAINSGGTDPLGQAGVAGRVNNHFWKIFGTSTLLSILGAGSANVGVGPSDSYTSISAYRDQIAQSFQDSSSKILEQYADIPPTITIKQGTSIKVFVAQDLDFSEALASRYPGNQMVWVR